MLGRCLASQWALLLSPSLQEAHIPGERHAQKHGGLFEITSLDTKAMENAVDHRELIRISETLDELGKVEPALAEVIDLKFFCGFTFAEIAALKGISERAVQRQWEKARIYLHRKIAMDLEA